ncbi:MAG: DUF2919 family protein [Thiogranum sp.]
MAEKYSIDRYDKNLCLRMNDTLWLILLFLLKPYLVMIISLVNRTDRTGIINMVYSDKMALWWGLLAGVPAVLVIYAWIKRKPGASSFARNLWRRGRALLAGSAVSSVAIVFIPFFMGAVHQVSKAEWIQLVISIGIVVTLYSSPYIKDCFSDYPSEADIDASTSS